MVSYWCHTCQGCVNVTITSNDASLPDETRCEQCGSEFIEIIEEQPQPTATSSPSSTTTTTTTSTSIPPVLPVQPPQPFGFQASPSFGAHARSHPFQHHHGHSHVGHHGPQVQQFGFPHRDPFFMMNSLVAQMNALQSPVSANGGPTTTQHFFVQTDPQNNPFMHFQNFFNQFLQSDFGNVAFHNFMSTMGLHSNPGDYVSTNNFHEVLNQLFQSAGCRGTPPAAKEVLEKLPIVQADEAFLRTGHL